MTSLCPEEATQWMCTSYVTCGAEVMLPVKVKTAVDRDNFIYGIVFFGEIIVCDSLGWNNVPRDNKEKSIISYGTVIYSFCFCRVNVNGTLCEKSGQFMSRWQIFIALFSLSQWPSQLSASAHSLSWCTWPYICIRLLKKDCWIILMHFLCKLGLY